MGSKGWAVDHQPGTSVGGLSHHDHKKSDLQVSKRGSYHTREAGKEGNKGDWIIRRYYEMLYVCVPLHMCAPI